MRNHFEICRIAVRRKYPGAKVMPTALMFVVEDESGREIGQRASTPERAWMAAYKVLVANAD